MATSDERRKLLSVVCPWCHAKPKEECFSRDRAGKRRALSTLDGGCHDARWQAALGYEAAVITGAVEQYHTPREEVDDEREPQLVGAGLPERPW